MGIERLFMQIKYKQPIPSAVVMIACTSTLTLCLVSLVIVTARSLRQVKSSLVNITIFTLHSLKPERA